MKLPAFLVLGLAALSFLTAGCNSSSRMTGLSVTVINFRPLDATMLESRATLTLRYINESIVPFGMSGSKHKLYLNGSYVGTAVSDRPMGIPPLQTATQDVTINLENLALVRQLLAVRESQTIAYRLDSVLMQTVADETYDNKTRSQGVLDLRALSGAATPQP